MASLLSCFSKQPPAVGFKKVFQPLEVYVFKRTILLVGSPRTQHLTFQIANGNQPYRWTLSTLLRPFGEYYDSLSKEFVVFFRSR